MSEQYHAVCNECGGGGCDECHGGWQCTMEDIGKCNKCDMGWPLGTVSYTHLRAHET